MLSCSMESWDKILIPEIYSILLKLHKIRVVFFLHFLDFINENYTWKIHWHLHDQDRLLAFFFENATESRPTNINQIQLIFMKLVLLKNSQRLKKFCNIFRNKTLYGTFYLWWSMAESQNPSEIERNWRKMLRLAASIGIYDYFLPMFTRFTFIWLSLLK